MTNRAMFIVFEGLDGSGKSTCAKLLAARIGAELMTTPTPRVRAYRDDLIDGLGPSQEARQLFYLATVFAASREATALLDRGRSVVLDRYFLSTQAYAAFRGSRLEVDGLQALLRPADLTVYIDTPLATRISRLQQRGTSAADLETIDVLADRRLIDEHLRRSCMSVVGRFSRIPGDIGGPHDVLGRVLAEVAKFASAPRP